MQIAVVWLTILFLSTGCQAAGDAIIRVLDDETGRPIADAVATVTMRTSSSNVLGSSTRLDGIEALFADSTGKIVLPGGDIGTNSISVAVWAPRHWMAHVSYTLSTSGKQVHWQSGFLIEGQSDTGKRRTSYEEFRRDITIRLVRSDSSSRLWEIAFRKARGDLRFDKISPLLREKFADLFESEALAIEAAGGPRIKRFWRQPQ